jgi:hypothetical protein
MMNGTGRLLSLSSILAFLALAFSPTSEAGNIFFWMPLGSKSHFIVFQPLLVELAKRNHSLTVVAPMKDKKLMAMDNVRYIFADTEHLLNGKLNSSDIFEGKEMDMGDIFNIFVEVSNNDVYLQRGCSKIGLD